MPDKDTKIPEGKFMSTVKVGPKGQIVIPKGARDLFDIEPGDTLYVYTDGVAEATNAESKLFGTERMLQALNGSSDKACRKILENVSGGIHAFVQEAPQFDDITMVALTYYGETGEH